MEQRVVNPRHLSLSNDHFTPGPVVEAARFVMGGIDLDPASSEIGNTVIRATRFFTPENNGLKQEWTGRAFVNPPGAKSDNLERRVLIKCEETGECGLPIGHKHEGTESSQKKWWFKLAQEYDAGRVTQAIFVGFSVEILQTTQVNPTIPIFPLDFPLCFPRNRLAYWREEHDGINGGMKLVEGKSPPHASVLIYLPPKGDKNAVEAFRERFSVLGRVLIPAPEYPAAWKPQMVAGASLSSSLANLHSTAPIGSPEMDEDVKSVQVAAMASKISTVVASTPNTVPLPDEPEPEIGSQCRHCGAKDCIVTGSVNTYCDSCGVAWLTSPDKFTTADVKNNFQTSQQENWSALAMGLGARGIAVDLPTICGWTSMKRDVAKLYAEQGGSIPPFLDEYRVDGGQGCAGCDSGKPFTAETEFLHTGMGPRCRIPLTKAAPDPAVEVPVVKRGRGRPRKNPLPETSGSSEIRERMPAASGLLSHAPAHGPKEVGTTQAEILANPRSGVPHDPGPPIAFTVEEINALKTSKVSEAAAQEAVAVGHQIHEGRGATVGVGRRPEVLGGTDQKTSSGGGLQNQKEATILKASEVAAPPPLSPISSGPKPLPTSSQLCGTCQSFERCQWLISRKPEQTGCDFTPNRWSPIPKSPAQGAAIENISTDTS